MRPVAALLTGVGYIGAALLRRLVERGERVVALDNFYSTPRESVAATLPECASFIEGDVADPQVVAAAFRKATADRAADLTVYHLAAQPSAAAAMREPDVTERSNLAGARLVLEAARDRAAKVVFGGSFRVYGDDLLGQTIDEETPYGRVGDLSHLSKIYVEQLGRMLGGDFISVRLGVTYGLSPIMKNTPAFMTVPNLFCQRGTRSGHDRPDRAHGTAADAAPRRLGAGAGRGLIGGDVQRAFSTRRGGLSAHPHAGRRPRASAGVFRRPMRVLVTGASGLIGRHTLSVLREH